MSRDLTRYEPFDPQDASMLPGYGTAPEEPRESMWKMLDDRMHGRWRLMLVIGAALSVLLAFMGYTSTSIKYESTGWVRIKPTKQAITVKSGEHTLDNFYSFVQTHVQLIQSRRVLERALESERIAKYEWAQDPGAVLVLQGNLEVLSDRNSELIHVSFRASDGSVAQEVVNSIIEAYVELFANGDGLGPADRITTLREKKKEFERELHAVENERKRLLVNYETGDLHELQRLRLRDLREIEDDLEIARSHLARHEMQEEVEDFVLDKTPDPQALEFFDPRLKEARQALELAQVDLEVVRMKYRDGSTAVRNAEQWVSTARRRYDELYNIALRNWQENGGVMPTGVPGDDPYMSMPPEVLARSIESLDTKRDRLVEEAQALAADLDRLAKIQFEEKDLMEQIDSYEGTIRYLETELPVLGQGWISVAQWGYEPPQPNHDSRKKRALAGFVGGFLVSFGAFFVLGSVDRRAYGPTQLAAEGVATPPCLGVLPDLGKSLTDPGSSEVAAHCVHQIRNQIEALREPGSGYALAISSPFQGDGKTSIVMALGWSYAVAGFRTLVIDCDMVGRSLTRQLGLVGREGLREALLARTIGDEIASLPMRGLSALPVGVDARFGSESLRRADLETLFGLLRDDFDIMLVDTGPMLGSLESTPVVAAADGVVLSVRRGRMRSRLEECIQKLQSVRATCVGLILNCAVRSDCYRYVSEASLAAAETDAEHRERRNGSAITVLRAADGDGNAVMRAMESASQTHRPDA